MQCNRCGMECGGQSFCMNCGNALVNERKRSPILPIVIAVIVLIAVAVAAVLVLGGRESSDDAVSSSTAYLEAEEYENAIGECEDILAQDDMNVDAYLRMAEIYDLMGDVEAAVNVLEEGYEKTKSPILEIELSMLVSDDTSVYMGDEVEMPNMIGMTWDEAYSKYASYLDLVAQQEWSEYEKDQIFEQELPEGRKVKVGTTITVKVSKGIKQVEVQDLSNRTVDAAERQLKKDGFKVKKTYEESDEIPMDNIIRTEPAAHEMAPQGSTVTLIISLGAPETLMSVPKLTDMPIETALERCEEYHLIPEIEYVDTEEFEKGTVISQSIEPNEHVERDTEIILEVSTGEIAEKTKKFSFAIPDSAEGEFEFLYYIDGIRDTERGEEIRDIGVEYNKTIPYEISGRTGEVKELVIKVRSVATGKTGTYLAVRFAFNADSIKHEIIETNKEVFEALLQP